MPLKMHIKPGERVVINGAEILFERSSRFYVLTPGTQIERIDAETSEQRDERERRKAQK